MTHADTQDTQDTGGHTHGHTQHTHHYFLPRLLFTQYREVEKMTNGLAVKW